MAALIVGAAVLVLLLLLARGFAFADIKRLAKTLRRIGAVSLALVALGLAATGRYGPAVFAASVAWALLLGERFRPQQPRGDPGRQGSRRAPRRGAMSRAEALEVLGLKEGASKDEIRAAHRRLIVQTHPDKGGSNYLAAKINEAKDILLG